MATGVATITHVVGGDDRFTTGSVTVRVADTTATAGVIVSEDVLSVAEGAAATYTVVLNAVPVANVTVTPGKRRHGRRHRHRCADLHHRQLVSPASWSP